MQTTTYADPRKLDPSRVRAGDEQNPRKATIEDDALYVVNAKATHLEQELTAGQKVPYAGYFSGGRPAAYEPIFDDKNPMRVPIVVGTKEARKAVSGVCWGDGHERRDAEGRILVDREGNHATDESGRPLTYADGRPVKYPPVGRTKHVIYGWQLKQLLEEEASGARIAVYTCARVEDDRPQGQTPPNERNGNQRQERR